LDKIPKLLATKLPVAQYFIETDTDKEAVEKAKILEPLAKKYHGKMIFTGVRTKDHSYMIDQHGEKGRKGRGRKHKKVKGSPLSIYILLPLPRHEPPETTTVWYPN